jgi:calcineurin-like phosphoesterase family protein
MVFFIADPHFGHENIIRLCGRPFSSVREMDEAMVSAWNSRVEGKDTVWILGDMFYRCENPEAILWRLKGKKRLILGNHDGSWTDRVELSLFFESVDTLLETTEEGREMTLCHYPLLTWNQPTRTWMIHGHIHNDVSADYWPLLRGRENVLNAGVEINGYRPVTFDELLANNAAFKASHPGQAKR